jgi:enoyl-CoA hydratase
MAAARALADTIGLTGPLAIQACTQSAQERTVLPLREALANEKSFSANVFMSDDAKEGIRAFKEKRVPIWQGR